MNGVSHKVIGITTVAALAATSFPTFSVAGVTVLTPLALVLAEPGSKAADVDIEGSEYGRKFPMIAKICKHRGITHTGLAVLAFCLPIALMARADIQSSNSVMMALIGGIIAYMLMGMKMDKNLGSPLDKISNLICIGGVLISLLIALFCGGDMSTQVMFALPFGFALAYASHIGADSFNGKGTPLLWPICRRNIHLMSVSTGTWQEPVFVVFYVSVVITHIVCVYTGLLL